MSVTVCERWFCAPSGLAEVDPPHARDLIVQRFSEVQRETTARTEKLMGTDTNLIRAQARDAVRDAFEWTGGDYDNPDKASLVRVLGSLAEIASVLGTPRDIIEQHTQEIVMVLRRLPD